jgi:hypothetical protein
LYSFDFFCTFELFSLIKRLLLKVNLSVILGPTSCKTALSSVIASVDSSGIFISSSSMKKVFLGKRSSIVKAAKSSAIVLFGALIFLYNGLLLLEGVILFWAD